MVDPATLAGPVDGVLITKGSLFFSPPSLFPVHDAKSKRVGRGIGDAEGDAFRRETKRKRFDRSNSPRACDWFIDFLFPIDPLKGGREGKENPLVGFSNDYAR